MINGEGTREIVSEVAFPERLDEFLPWQEQKSDGSVGDLASPVSSQYSSCGDSEFERYCSANSVMGTPSMSSSIGSIRSFGFGDDAGLEGFSLGGRFDRNNDDGAVNSLYEPERFPLQNEKIDLGLRNTKNEVKIGECVETTGAISSEKALTVKIGPDFRRVAEKGVSVKGNKEGLLGTVGSSRENTHSQGTSKDKTIEGNVVHGGAEEVMGLQFEEEGIDEVEDSTSSRHEHSDDEDSMYNYGSDDDHRNQLYFRRNLQCPQEAKTLSENPLLINSSIAFGLEDWNEFALETEGDSLASLSFNKFQDQKNSKLETERNILNSNSANLTGSQSFGSKEQGNDVADIPLPLCSKEVQGTDESTENINSYSVTPVGFQNHRRPIQAADVGDYPKNSSITLIVSSDTPEPLQDMRDMPVTRNQVQGTDGSEEYLNSCSVSNVFEMELDPLAEKSNLDLDFKVMEFGKEKELSCVNSEGIISIDDNSCALEKNWSDNSKAQLVPLSASSVHQLCSQPPESLGYKKVLVKDQSTNSTPPIFEDKTSGTLKNSSESENLLKNHPAPVKTDSLEINEFYDDIVNEMEEILLDSSESPGARFHQGILFQSQKSLPLRDGGSTASTSGLDDAYPQIQHPLRFDRVEVVGAKQKKGDISLSERLVGVKEYTVYIIRVWNSNDQWEVERRYRDFFTLYRRLKTLFADKGWLLPSPWLAVEKESRKFFGNASPDVIAERSVLIQESLQSILHSGRFPSPPSALVWFLSPQDTFPSSPASKTLTHQSSFFSRGTDAENVSTLGKTISLIVEIRPNKSIKQMLESQHYTCAGCHKHFDDGKTLMQDVVQTFGWGRPRLCEYTGQLFCSSCHTNETTVLPARVLHHWDFTQYPVSQLAKSFLESIHDQPMLCVSAVNPFLFTKVPALLQVMGVRKKIGILLPYVRCPFNRAINKGLGSRRYLLENNDFFALRELIDLSKGAFAALPMMLETVSKKILEHITEQCLVCCDVGVPCNARQACCDPSSLIFPFQLEDEIERCKSCELAYHKQCFKKLKNCPCGVHLNAEGVDGSTKKVSHEAGSGVLAGALDLFGRTSGSGLPAGFLSGLFSKASKENKKEHKEGDNVILMGSLPNTAL